jgi:hypothetical protein
MNEAIKSALTDLAHTAFWLGLILALVLFGGYGDLSYIYQRF